MGFMSHYAGPHLMALALGESLPAITGTIDYAPAFAALGWICLAMTGRSGFDHAASATLPNHIGDKE